VIGLTVVAIGTSMPELVTSVVAARRGHGDVAFGNILGSNIFNILGILGITALVKPLAVPEVIADFDIWVMLAATALLVATAVSGWRITRLEGAILLACYIAYLAWLVAGV
jgi:cation:H+ antiporter